jgi:hypothetical protein
MAKEPGTQKLQGPECWVTQVFTTWHPVEGSHASIFTVRRQPNVCVGAGRCISRRCISRTWTASTARRLARPSAGPTERGCFEWVTR